MTEKHILVFGAGKSASVLIDFLKNKVAERNWLLTVVDGNKALVDQKAGNHTHTRPLVMDIADATTRRTIIETADVVISMLPPSLHFLIAQDCLQAGKHLLTASYIDDNIRKMAQAVEDKGLLFLCEMGLDPGIDHMSAMQLIDHIKAQGGLIQSFRSHCGGLVAPESDNNPWHYKISWNPRNVVMAGKAGAIFKKTGHIHEANYQDVFTNCDTVHIPNLGSLAFYPNRDSLGYIPTYGLEAAQTFIRTTLRYPEFCTGWNAIVKYKMTDETTSRDTNGVSYADFWQSHFQQHQIVPEMNNVMLKKQFEFLGINSPATINKGTSTAADVLQHQMEQHWVLDPADKDMIVMLHEITYSLNGQTHEVCSSLIVKGKDSIHTAMAATVGLPLGIAALLLLEGRLKTKGLQLPILPEIYNQVLPLLAEEGIVFNEKDRIIT